MIELAPPYGAIRNASLLVHDEAGGQAFYFPCLGRGAFFIEHDGKGWGGVELPGEGKDQIEVFILIGCEHHERFAFEFLIQAFHRGHFAPAGRAPGRPKIHQHDFAFVVGHALDFAVQILEREIGCGRARRECREFVREIG